MASFEIKIDQLVNKITRILQKIEEIDFTSDCLKYGSIGISVGVGVASGVFFPLTEAILAYLARQALLIGFRCAVGFGSGAVLAGSGIHIVDSLKNSRLKKIY